MSGGIEIASKLNASLKINEPSVKCMKYQSTDYCYLVTDLPVFYQIKSIIITDKHVLLVALSLETLFL